MRIMQVAEVPPAYHAKLRQMVPAMISHFAAVRGTGAGIGPGSCCAVGRLGTRYVYGNSQAYQLDLDAAGLGRAHAERVVSGLSGSWFIFVELAPCDACRRHFENTDVVLVFLFPYTDAGRQEWTAFHNSSEAQQLAAWTAALLD